MNTEQSSTSLQIEYPSLQVIRQAYRELPRRGHLHASVKVPDLPTTLRAFEEAGFYGMMVEAENLELLDCEIVAFKGKQGQCFDTGRSATYRGAGLAALDDDNHLIVGTMRVCEKTGVLHASPPYGGLIEVTEADPALLDRLATDPLPFDCDTLEADAARLRGLLSDPVVAEDRVAIYYGGPFRAVVLADGTVVRRGESTTVPRKDQASLLEEGGFVPGKAFPPGEPRFFQTLYDQKGAVALLGDLPLAEAPVQAVELNLDALSEVSDELRQRLLQLIEREEGQFLVTGSDPRSPFGCCPDPKVGEANALVEAGVLSSQRMPAPPDACPTTLYAFRGELRADETGRTTSVIDRDFRNKMVSLLKAPK